MRALRLATLVAALAVCLCAAPARSAPPSGPPQAANPPYLAEMPSADRVRAEIRGPDPMETAARQMGACWQLQEIIKGVAGPRFLGNQLTGDEKHWIGQYAAACQQAAEPFANYPDRPTSYRMHARYETSSEFLDGLLGRFFSPGLQEMVCAARGQQGARAGELHDDLDLTFLAMGRKEEALKAYQALLSLGTDGDKQKARQLLEKINQTGS